MANPPPPYANITGISRADMKDNSQETLSQYNGNARPGELVVDLTTYQLYIGNADGNLNIVTGGGNGSPGGANSQVQYNNNGLFAGDSTFTFDGGTNVLSIPDTVVTGNVVPSVSNTYSLGSSTLQWKDMYVSSNTIYINNVPLSGNTGGLTYNNQPVVIASNTAPAQTSNIATTASVIAGNVVLSNATPGGGIVFPDGTTQTTAAGSANYGDSNVAAYLASGTVTSNIITSGEVLSDTLQVGAVGVPGTYYVYANATGASIGQTAAQNITLGNSGIQIAGTGGVNIQGAAGANVTLGGGTTGNVVFPKGITFADGTWQNTAGGGGSSYSNANVSAYLASGTDTAGFTTTGPVNAASANIGGLYGYSNTIAAHGTTMYLDPAADGSPLTGEVVILGNASAAGNVTGSYFIGNGSLLTGLPAGYSNADVAAYLASGNVSTAITTTANVSGAYFLGNIANATGLGNVSTINLNGNPATMLTGNGAWTAYTNYSNANVSNYLASGLMTANILTSGNVVGGNVGSAGVMEALGNVVGANFNTAGVVSATGNATAANFTTAGNVSATGNATAANFATAGNVAANVVQTTNVTGTSVTISATGATQNIVLSATGNITASGAVINNVGSPLQANDAATKSYVDANASGLVVIGASQLATAAALPAYTYNNGTAGVGATITANANGALTVDGVAATLGDRVLVKNETAGNAPYNGVYTVTATGGAGAPFVLTRATDNDQAADIPGAYTLVTGGNTNANTGWSQSTAAPITIGTTAILWSQFSSQTTYQAGNALVLSGAVFNVVPDGVTTTVNGSNQLAVKASANLVTPNIGAATFSTLTATANTTGNISAGNVTVTGDVTANYFVGNGSTLSGIVGANVLGAVPLATLATTANVALTVAGGNVSGVVANAIYAAQAGTATTATTANVALSVAGANVSGEVANAAFANIAAVSYSVDGANVVGEVANAAYATIAGAADTAALANVALSVAGANVTGFVANATLASTANVASVAYSVAGANVTGTVANATYATSAGSATTANVALSVAGANVTGAVANATYADTAAVSYSVDAANVVGEVANAAYATSAGSATTANVALTVAGANVTGFVANATLASTANVASVAYSVAGANVTGFVANATLADNANVASTAYSVDLANVAGAGNIASINLNGSTTQVLAGNGAWITPAAGYSNSNVSTYLASGTNSAGISTTGNVAGDNGVFNEVNINNNSTNALLFSNIDRNVTTTSFTYDSVNNDITSGQGNISLVGNISASYLLGNIANATGLGNVSTVNLNGNSATFLTGAGTFVGAVAPASIANGTSSVDIATADGDITFTVAGNNIATFNNDIIAIGEYAATVSPSPGGIAIGFNAGHDTQFGGIAIGTNAGYNIQGADAIAIGKNAGAGNDTAFPPLPRNAQGGNAIAIGVSAAANYQSANSIAIGYRAGFERQGVNSIAIGALAANSAQANNSIVISASGTDLPGTNSGFYVSPVRNDTGNVTNVVYYNTSTKEVTYGPGATPYGNANVASYLASGTVSTDIVTTGEVTAAVGSFTSLAAPTAAFNSAAGVDVYTTTAPGFQATVSVQYGNTLGTTTSVEMLQVLAAQDSTGNISYTVFNRVNTDSAVTAAVVTVSAPSAGTLVLNVDTQGANAYINCSATSF